MTDSGSTSQSPGVLPPYSPLPEPMLNFQSGGRFDSHPLRGLVAHGPYTRTSLAAYTPTVRVATVGPQSSRGSVRGLIQGLRQQYRPTDRAEYVPEYPGFAALFGVDIALADDASAHIAWPESLGQLARDGSDIERLGAALADVVGRLSLARGSFDMVAVHLPDAWESATRAVDFDAHDQLKALAAVAGIPTQVLNDRVFSFGHPASRSWRLAIACYVKAGGVPWKLAPLPGVPDRTAYIGLAYALRGNQDQARFVTCCSQVFDADGGGMQFVAYDARDPVEDTDQARRNPYLSRDDMRAVLARSLRLYQSRNAGQLPRRIVLHKTTGFQDQEIDGAAEALAGVPEFDCIEVTTQVAWRAVWLKPSRQQGARSEPDGFPVHRGTMLPLSGTSGLLWAAGNAATGEPERRLLPGKEVHSATAPTYSPRRLGCARTGGP